MKKYAFIVMLCLSVVALASVAQAAVTIADFEDGGTGGFQNYAGNPIVNAAAPLAGMGNLSGQVTINNQYWGQIVMQQWANSNLSAASLNAGSQISFDLDFPSSGFNWGYTDVTLDIQNQGGVGGDQDSGQMTQHLDSIVPDTLYHMTFDYSSMLPWDPTATGQNLVLWITPGWGPNSYTPQTVYIDNVAVTGEAVPEPATFVLLGMGGLMLFVLRRKS